MSNQQYQAITDSIIKALESGSAPWVKPWNASTSGLDRNAVTDRPYNGINRLLLGMQGRTSPLWATYNQWQSLGAQVQKGQKSTTIVLFKPVSTERTNSEGETEVSSFAMMKSFAVFNADQTDYQAPAIEATGEFNPIAQCEERMMQTGAVITHGGDRAFYQPSTDSIRMPIPSDFVSEASYYATAFHELAHWTGAKHRLDRTFGARFGDAQYALEELTAELTSAFLCADHGIDGKLQHVEYIASWLKVLKDDNKAIFKASAMAQKASDYILSLNEAQQRKAA
jgi:antirestriction protein ArdC